MDITYYTTYDLPVPYKSISLHPVTVKDYMLFNIYAQCLTLEKNTIPDAKIISMSNLEYMFYASQQSPETLPYVVWFDRLLAMCLKGDKSFDNVLESMKRYRVDGKGKPFFIINKETYKANEFDEIKTIVSQQNLLDLPDMTISKEVRDSLDQAREYKNKLTGTKSGTFEDYMVSLSVATGWNLDYIYAMSIRKFLKCITRLDNLIHYKIYLAASMSGMVEFKDTSFIKHWLTRLDDGDKYKDVSLELEAIQGKVSMESAKQDESKKYS